MSEAQNSITFSPAQNVGVSSTLTVSMTATAPGTVYAVKVLTMGQPNLDFTLGSGGSTCLSTILTPKSFCSVSVTFDPKYPGVRRGAIVLLDNANNTLGITYLSGTGVGALGVMVPGTITTVAGSGDWTGLNDGDAATSGDLYLPAGVVVDGAGDMFIADSAHNRIREVYASGTNAGEITTLCNTTGQPAYSGDGGQALDATLSNPQGIAIDGAGNLFIADTGNNAIRRIDAFTGVITSVVNQEPTSSTTSSAGFSGDGGAATSALLDTPYGVAVASNGDLYIADSKNQRIRKVTATTQVITTVAGNGTTVSPGVGSYSGDGGSAVQAELNAPYAVTLDSAGNLYIADTGNNRVRVVYASGSSAGIIATYAGTGTAAYAGDGGLATSASLYAPSGLIFDVAGNLYVADTQNNRVRKINTAGTISTAAGNGTGKYEGDGAAATAAGIYGPQGLFLDQLGNLFIADYFDQRIRVVVSNTAILPFPTAIREDQVSSPQSQAIENDGNAALSFTGITNDQNAAIDAASTTCSTTTTLASDASCTVGAEFAPTQVGDPLTGNINLTGNPANAPLDIEVEGISEELTSTTTTLSATPNPALYGSAVVLSATVTTGTDTLSGSVTFKDGATTIGTATLASSGLSGTATLSTSTLSVGAHSITAVYNSDGTHGTSTSTAFTETIQQSTTTALASSANPSVSGGSVIFTATVTGSSGGTAPTGTVVFKDGATTLGSVAITGSTASFTTSTLTVGTHAITASYSGDSLNAASTSAVVSQLVKASTAVTITPSANPATFGTTVSFTAKVSGNGDTPTGSISFTIDGAAAGSATLNGGSASISTSTLTVGSHAVVATYGGDSNDGTSTSTGMTEVVNKATATVTLTSALNPAASGASVTFTAVVKGGSTAPTGTVILEDSGTPIGSQTLAGGSVSYTSSTLAVGTHTITAVYQGDTNYATVTSAAVSEKILPDTKAVVISSANPSIAGTAVTFTATVTGSTTPTGTVTFVEDGTTTLGATSLSGGVGSVKTTALAAGTHSITAVYAGDTNNAATTSVAYAQTVNKATTQTAVTASANPTTAGKSVTLTATVTGNGGTPGGTVTFYSGGTSLGTATLSTSGVATLATTKLLVGTDAITVSYAGDTNDSASNSSSYSLSVVTATTSLSLVSSANPAIALKSVSFTATVTGNGGTPTGTVIFSDGGKTLGSESLVSGVATYSTTALAVGTHAITAAYQGDANDGTATGSLTETIQQASPTIAVTATANPATMGATVTLSAALSGQAGTPTGTVTFKDGSTTLGTVNIASNGTATFSLSTLTLGQHSITAAYTGDTNNAAATSPATTETIQESTTTALISSKNPSVGGTAVTFTATVAGTSKGTVTGTVTFHNGSAVLGTAAMNGSGVATFTTSSLAVGTDDITAVYGGDTLDVTSTSATVAQVVQSAGTATALTSSANPALLGASVTFTATVTGSGSTPTGTVTFEDGTTAIGTANLSSSGVATLTTSTLAVGTHTVTAVYSGDADNEKGSSTALNETIQAQAAVTVTSSANPQLAAASITFTATVTNGSHGTPTGSVSFKDGATVLATVTLPSTGIATYSTSTLAVGTHSITAVYSGDTLDTAATSAALSQAVTAIATKTTLAASPTSVTTEQTVSLVASVFSSGSVPITGTVSFENGSTVIGTASVSAASTATLAQTLAAGTYSIVAVYSGDTNNAASTSSAVTVTVTAADDFSMNVNPSSITMASKQYQTVTLTLASASGFADTLALGCASLPASVTCSFSKDSVALAANGTATVQVTVDTSSPLTAGGSAKNDAPQNGGSRTALAWAFPGSILMGLVFWRFRRKHGLMHMLAAVVLLGGMAFGLTGCGGLSENGAAAGSYSFDITATGQKTGMDHAVTINLTVSQ